MSEKAGGLGIPDLKSFWLSLKFSWLRRACNTNAFWPNILAKEVSQIINKDVTIIDILQFGPNFLSFIGKKLKNQFWKPVLCAVNPFMQGAIFCHPENITNAPIWENPLITRNNKPMKMTSYANLSEKIKTLSDFYYPGSTILYTKEELEAVYDVTISQESYIELKYIFHIACRKLGLNDTYPRPTFRPFQPLLIQIANVSLKGCSSYYKFLRKKLNLKTNLSVRENKWHNELGLTFGADYWNKIYILTAGIKNENKMKYLQYQINRNSLYTNYKVNKFKNYISPFCYFCTTNEATHPVPPHPELVSHLFFHCDYVLNLWTDVKGWLSTVSIEIPLDIKILLFGLQDQQSNSVNNFIILSVKYYIWKTKHQNQELSLHAFKSFLKYKIENVRNAFIYEGKEHSFEPFVNVYDNLSRME